MDREERGAALVEFALALPLLLVVIAGIVDFGFTFQRYEVVTNAAREGARMAQPAGLRTRPRSIRASGLTSQTASVRHTAALGDAMPTGAVTLTNPEPFAIAVAGG